METEKYYYGPGHSMFDLHTDLIESFALGLTLDEYRQQKKNVLMPVGADGV